jgi:hypothetical protein
MSRLLAAATDFAQITEGTGKKFGAFQVGASGLWLPVSVLSDEAGNTIDSAVAEPTAATRGLVVREPVGSRKVITSPTGNDLFTGVQGTSESELNYRLPTSAVLEYYDAAQAANSKLRTARGDDANGLDVDVTRVQGNVTTVPLQRATYRAMYRLAARPYAISKAFTAGSRFQFATLHHAATSTKKVRVRRVTVAVESSTVAGLVVCDLMKITSAPATGNPAITPAVLDGGDAAAEATALALPTTAGTESAAVIASKEWNLGATATGSVINPPPPLQYIDLFSEADLDPEEKAITLRAGVLEGIAVTFDCSAATTLKAFVIIRFTEE